MTNMSSFTNSKLHLQKQMWTWLLVYSFLRKCTLAIVCGHFSFHADDQWSPWLHFLVFARLTVFCSTPPQNPFIWPHPDLVNSPELPYCSCKLPIALHGIPSHSFIWYSAHICRVNGSVNSSVAQIWWQAWEGCAGWREHQIDSAEVGVYQVNGRQQRDQPR